MTASNFTVVADDIENPVNVATLLDVAQMFAASCVFRDHAHLRRPELHGLLAERAANLLSRDEIDMRLDPILVLDNVPGAADIYGFRPPVGPQPALVVGNERRGVSRELIALGDCAVQIPMRSRHLNSLNVAAATAVALYYLTQDRVAEIRTRLHPEKHRPELLFFAPSDHVELGSSIRSAAAFGWQRLLVEDAHRVWFGIERSTRAEGRAAARRFRNPIRVIPSSCEQRHAFDTVCVVAPRSDGLPLSRANLSGGSHQLLIVPDAAGTDVDAVDWERFGRRVTFVSLDLPGQPAQPPVRHYRCDTSITLAEAARQIGQPAVKPSRPRPPRAPRYDRILRYHPPELGEVIYLDELEDF